MGENETLFGKTALLQDQKDGSFTAQFDEHGLTTVSDEGITYWAYGWHPFESFEFRVI